MKLKRDTTQHNTSLQCTGYFRVYELVEGRCGEIILGKSDI